MEPKSLHIAMREAIEQFGVDVLTENRLVNILLDYGAYSDIPAAKTIVQAMIAGGYSQKIIDLGKQKRSFLASLLNSDETIGKPEGEEWRNKLESYSAIVTKQNGFQRPLVDYVSECIIYGLDWIDYMPETPKPITTAPTQNKPHGPQPKQVNSSNTSGTNTNKTNSVSYQNIVDSQFLVMKVTPVNAEVYVDGKQQYVSKGIMAVELPVGVHSFEVKADSYETQTGNVTINNISKSELSVELKLEQKTIMLTINAIDADTEIYINGVCYGKGMWEGLVNEGTYDIEGRKYRYQSHKQTVILQGKNKEEINIPSLIALCGNLKVNVQPYGSTIIINGQEMGQTPLLVSNIIIGERNLIVKTSEGTQYSTVVDVRENQVTDVNHKIPSLFLNDYSHVRIGDFFYDDGTYSHLEAKGKDVVGRVFSLKTSPEEQRLGWTHGQIVAINNIDSPKHQVSSWGIINSEIREFAIQNPGFAIGKDNGYLVSHMDCILNNPEFVPFMLAANYNAKLPFGKTSGWYLPCLAQWKTMYDNMHSNWEEYWYYLKFAGTRESKEFATSTIYDRNNAWKYHMGMAEEYILKAYQKESIKTGWGHVRAVAAF